MAGKYENLIDLGLKDKVVVLTGAAMGIGKALLHAFDQAGCRVVAVDREKDLLFQTLSGLKNPDIHYGIVKDLAEADQCESIAGEVEARYGRLDILVNNAGVVLRVPVAEVTPDMWKNTGDINLRSQFLLCRSAAEVMKKNGYGRIINMSSQGHFTGGFDNSVVYSAFKGATVTMSKGMARQYAPFGITVNVVAPGPADTRMMACLTKERLAEFLDETVLMKRLAQPREIALPVLFLASKWADYMTGVTLDVNGGIFMR